MEKMLFKFSFCLCLLLSLFYSPIFYGTVFFPTSLKTQLDEASAVIHGIYLGQSTKMLSSPNEVVTVFSFRLLTSAGLSRNEILNNNEIHVLSPGGEWLGVNYSFQGTPTF